MSLWRIDLRQIRRAAGWAVGLVVVAGPVVLAQAPQNPQEFLPLTDAGRETLPALPLLYIAYAFVWLALLAYVFLLWRRIGRVERELADVNAKLASRR